MRRTFLFVIILTIFLIPCAAQEEKQENFVCNELRTASLTVAKDKILVAGWVVSPAIIKVREQTTTLSQYIAMTGGVKRGTANNKNILVFNCSFDSGMSENTIFADYKKIIIGDEPDLELKGGEIVIVQRRDIKQFPSVLPAFDEKFGCGIRGPKHKR